MTATCTIGGVSFIMIEDQHDLTNALDERQRFQVDVIDYTGAAHFVKGEQVTVTDPNLGTMYSGYLVSAKEIYQYPTGAILYTIDCSDQSWLAAKRTYTRTYSTPQLSSKIAVDQLHDVLLAEGITQNFALKFDTTQSDFSQGILSSTFAASNVGDGDLELAKAGSDLTITEATTADFASGTLTHMTASNNTLTPTTVSGLRSTSFLPYTAAGAFLNLIFWQGSKALGTNDTLNYDIWISGTSPQIMVTVNISFTDGTTATGLIDQNGAAIDATTDLSAYAKDQWYTRNISTSTYNGKTVASVFIAYGGTSPGTYTCFVKNIYLSSAPGSPFFSTTATITQQNPPLAINYAGYVVLRTTGSVVPVYDPATSLRTSTSHSIDVVKLLGSSVVTWTATTLAGATFVLKVSYDGGTTYQQCANNAALTNLPNGSNVAGLSLLLQESFLGSTDPSSIPVLSSINIQLVSAPAATKSDIVKTFATQSAWNTGTLSGTVALANGDLTCTTVTRNWNDGLITNQTFFRTDSGTSQSASSGAYAINVTYPSSSTIFYAMSRLDFAGTLTSFTLDIDITIPTLGNANAVLITYRNTYWNNNFDPGKLAYTFIFWNSGSGTVNQLVRGTNSSTSTYTYIGSGSATAATHVRIVVNGNRHQCFVNNSTTPDIDVADSTYTASGSIGIGSEVVYNLVSGHAISTFDNLLIIPQAIATWTGPATSLSSLSTCGLSVISWTEVNTGGSIATYLQVASSVDSGSTYQICTNGSPIPNLPSGTNVSSISVQLQVSMTTANALILPIIRQLVWRVLGAYPGSSGTRSTVPLGLDTMIRSNVVGGWGTGFDGQTYTKNGTGTINLTSNEGQITNTTGDVDMVYGSRTGTDLDATDRFSLSASGATAMIKLRYQDANNYYALSASTTTLSIIKKSGGVALTLASISMVLVTGIYYRMRFRVVGTTQLYGNVWADGTLENTIDPTTYEWNNNNWTITASE